MGRAGGAPRAQAAATNDAAAAAAAAGEADAAAKTIVAAAAMRGRGRRGPRHRRRPLVVVIYSEMEYNFVSSERTMYRTYVGRRGDDGCRPWAEGIDAAAVAWGW